MMKSIELWHKRARPEPTSRDFDVQLGCHFEEFGEMRDTLIFEVSNSDDARSLVILKEAIRRVAEGLKEGRIVASIDNRKEFLDSLGDQVVTAIGTGYCAGMQTADAIGAVNSSNWSKFDDAGYPIVNANGKIAKGPNYTPPNLEGMY